MVTLIQDYLQQHRQGQDEGQIQYAGHYSKKTEDDDQPICERLEITTSSENAICNENYNSHCVDIESYCESTQSSDVEEDLEDDDLQNRGWVSEIPRTGQSCEIETVNGLPLPTVEPPNFGDVVIKNSSAVHLGSKTFYKGPVTIKQFLYTNSEVKKEEVVEEETEENSVPNQNSPNSKESLRTHQNINKIKQWLIKWKCAAFFCATTSMLVAIIITIIMTSAKNTSSLPVYPEIPDSSVGGDVVVEGVRFVPREDWLAQPPSGTINKLSLPVKYVIISHTASEFCYTQSVCTKRVRIIQTFHIESNGWADIGYNFLVGGDGLAYVGRGWDLEGAHTFNYNKKSIGISFIGTFIDFIPLKKQLHAVQKLIEMGVTMGKIREDYILLGHRQVSPTESPGNALYSIIKTWPHWSPKP